MKRSAGAIQKAFTLIELLVVMAIVAILASLLLPSLSRAKTLSHGLACLNNLKQWGLATHLFAADHEDYLPKDGTPNGTSTVEGWYVDLPRTLGLRSYQDMPWHTNAALDPGRSLWICSANPRRSNGNNLFHYCLNQHVNGAGAGQQIKLSAIGPVAQVVWLFDNGKLAAVAQQNNVHTNLHQGGAQFGFLDGHVARFPNKVYWDFALNQGRTNQPSLRWAP